MSGTKGARGRRFRKGLAPDAADLNASVSFDWRLLAHDVKGSIAHARMLCKQGLISSEDLAKIESGLLEVQKEFEEGAEFDPILEDVHMNVESRLIEKVGDSGRRLHTARSRNDQVATDMRLYARQAVDECIAAINNVIQAFVDIAEANIDIIIPGYTHLQRAQPVRLSHHLLAYVAMFRRDRERLRDARKRINICPLGAGALAGTPFPIDRDHVAAELGFEGITRNSLDASGDRDFAIEIVSILALCQAHLSRFGEELVLWLSQEFRFATLSESYCSGSSIMPQKVNPDLAELIRGKSGRVIGNWVSLITVLKGLPLAYNKDLQETQEPLYDSVETVLASLGVASGMVRNLEFNKKELSTAVDRGFLVATEVADYLVTKGIPFRDGHDIAGALVRKAIAENATLSELSLEDFRNEHPAFDKEIYEWLDVQKAVDRRNIVGGPARSQVEKEIKRLRKELSE